METVLRFYLATVFATLSLVPLTAEACAAHQGKRSTSAMKSGKKIAKVAVKPAPAPAPK